MSLLYNFDIDTPEDILQLLACNLQKRRLEKGLSRDALSKLSGVPSPTIAKFEQKFSISLSSYVALTKAVQLLHTITSKNWTLSIKIKTGSEEEMKLVNKLSVLYRDQKIGELTMTHDNRCCAFQYDKKWLISGFSISPLDLPLESSLFIAKPEPFWGNFGIFEDSLPDGYGRYLLNRLLKKQGINDALLTPIQRLSIVGISGMGALSYVPESYIGEEKSLPDLDNLQQMALEVLSEKSEEGEDILYFNSGNSGGCRPKCLWHDREGAWLVKFRHTYDPKDIGRMEYKYNEVARKCGINVPDYKLLDGKYFASKRFDIENGKRLHIATAGALLNESISNPKLDYKVLLHLTGYLTQDSQQVDEMFQRMVFNVLTDNKDDHVKNFSFICREGKWSLAPAYDLTLCKEGYHGEHATSANNKGNPDIEDMLAVGESIRIPRRKGMEIINHMINHCQEILSTRFE